MFTLRSCEVALKKCDATGQSVVTPMQNSTPHVGRENYPITPAAMVKVKNELDDTEKKSTYAIVGETSNTVDVSFKTVGDLCNEKETKSVNNPQVNGLFSLYKPTDCKQFDFLQTDRSIKTEDEEANLITSELVGHTVVDRFENAADNQNKVKSENADNLRGDTSVPVTVSSEQFHFSQTNMCIKIEGSGQGERLITSTFERCAIADNLFRTDADDGGGTVAASVNDRHGSVSISSNSPTCEDFLSMRTDLCIKSEAQEIEGSKTSDLKCCTVTDDSFNIAVDEEMLKANVKILQENDSGDLRTDFEQLGFPQTDVHIKMEEVEEGLITRELVGHLPGSLEDYKMDSKSLLNAVECEVSDENKPQVDFHHVSLTNDNDFFKGGERTLKQFSFTETDDKLPQCSCCAAKFIEKSKLLESLPKNSDRKPYLCSQCLAKFEQNGKFLTTHPADRHFECAHCDARFRSKRLLTCHVSKHFTGVTFPCRLVPTSHQAHVKPRPHTRHEYTCAHCTAKFKTKRSLVAHVITHKEKSFSCPHCSIVFKHRHELNSHVKRHAKEQPYYCDQCPKKFAHSSGLKSHWMRVHSGEKPFLCHQCPARFSLKMRLTRHLLVHSDERKYACSQCPAKFKCSFTRKRHSKLHSESTQSAQTGTRHSHSAQSAPRPYCCPHCSWRFKSEGNLSQHIKIVHSGAEKRHACDLCSYRTHNAADLTKHLVVHNGEKAFACDKCPQKFTRLASLKRHAPRHSNERPFVCEICSKTFKSKRCLQSHSKMHSSGSRYTCPDCPFMFKSLSRLKAHSKLHTSKTIFGCAHCPAIFSGRHNLLKHLTVHSGEKPFECAHCHHRFRFKNNLKTHITRLHKENGPPQSSFST